ncbi:MAG: F0F1 ATP synthase subunit A [Rhodospirillales bacterium]
MAAGGESPVHQFQVFDLIPIKLGKVDLSFTNASLWMVVAVGLIVLVMTLGANRRALIPGRLQSLGELGYDFIANLVRENVGSEGKKYFPFIFTLFMFVLFCNVLGMVPYSFSVTGQIIVTFALALTVFIGVTIIGIAKNGIGFLRLFAPAGVPIFVLPLLIPIEIISYFVRPVSLSVRLFLNIMVGHTMLQVFAGFVILLGFAGIGPLIFIVVFIGFELFVAVLQAYIFAILSCLYLHDALHPHH